MSAGPRVLIVDDHPLFRDALAAALREAYPAGAEARFAGSLAEAVAKLDAGPSDLVLLDLNLGDTHDFEGLTRLKTRQPDLPIVVVSATESPQAFQTARTLGAAGYLPKSLSLEDLSAALATTLDGGEWFPEIPGGEMEHSAPAARIASLTPAQRRVLAGLAEGLLNKQIAHEMDISVATVKAHMTAIFRKLGVLNRTQALLIYQEAISTGDHSAA
ncbi:response regulator transcription factor [Hyphomonas sp. WL0036]|uniref:response regulator transcription factor n=1 Tax=Hyphomonas sediminis TaxID=2866160 RepID=UPI001C81150D|nr:response regulator transcription factor [Hyphomonas sediminis]MBY9067386.1 response regulator transcription factor [Hyphomonas sediminis]